MSKSDLCDRLLDILAERKDPEGLEGQILIDGQPQPPSFTLMCGYITQDDVVSGLLTVRESILFSANLRLLLGVGSTEKDQFVNEAIKEHGLGSST